MDSITIFGRILMGELPCEKVYENDYVLAFKDSHPEAPVHVLVIPKNTQYANYSSFLDSGTDEEIQEFFRAVRYVTKMLKLDRHGYRLVANTGRDANQMVEHFHMHIIAGAPLGRSVSSY